MTDQARAQADGVLQVDAGDLLLPAPIPGQVAVDAGEIERRARLLFSGLRRIGLDAAVPGELDLSVGVERLSGWARAHKVALVAANVADRRGKPLFPADRLVSVGGVKIGVFGLLELPTNEPAPAGADQYQIGDAATAARAEVQALRARGAQLIVGLWHLPRGLGRAHELLQQAPGVDFVVLGHNSYRAGPAESEGTARILQTTMMGKSLGRLDLHLVGGSRPFVDRGVRAQVMQSRDSHRRQREDFQRRLEADPGGQMKAFFAQAVRQQEVLAEADEARLRALPAAVTGSWLEDRGLDLDTSYPDQTGLSLLVSAYNDESARRAARGLPVGVAPRGPGAAVPAAVPAHGPTPPVAPAGAAAPLSYTGTAACGECHAAALSFWKQTKHAQAMRTLRQKGRAGDPQCVGCHSTGYLQRGGTRDIKAAAEQFADVGCEACHGPGRGHGTGPDKKAGTRRLVDAGVCLGCHTPDQTDHGFDYAAFLKAIIGPGHGQAAK